MNCKRWWSSKAEIRSVVEPILATMSMLGLRILWSRQNLGILELLGYNVEIVTALHWILALEDTCGIY